jgi:predicted RNA-binding Zn ribbon-like protein
MGDWVWDGGRLSIDLLNTVRDRARSPRETLRTPADLVVWLREANLPHGENAVGEDVLSAARRLRAAIDALSQERAGKDGVPAALAVVNAMAAAAAAGPRLALNDSGLVAVPPEPSVAAALGRIALDAIDLLTGGERMRVCAADDCGIRFADRSPAQNRQWCSMRRCGNRSKARRHYTRTTT